MANKYLLIASLCLLTFSNCIFHGQCYRSIGGTINTDLSVDSLRIRICRDYGSGYDSNCDTRKIEDNGSYKLSDLQIDPQNDCSNDCSNKYNNTLPNKIIIQIYKSTSTDDSILKEVQFSCEKDFSFSGNDIQLPVIEIP